MVCIESMPLTHEEMAAVRELAARVGGVPQAKEVLIRMGLGAYRAMHGSLPIPVPESRAPQAPPRRGLPKMSGLSILADALARHGVEVVDARAGRPNIVRVHATQHRVGIGEVEPSEWCEILSPGDLPTPAALLYAARRTRGNAQFALGSFMDEAPNDPGPGARAKLFFFVLASEKRVWVATRRQLQDCYRSLEAGKKTLESGDKLQRISLTKHWGNIRMLFPRKEIWMDLTSSVSRPATAAP